jgi:hypothetical protein
MQLNPSRASAAAERSLLDPFHPTRALLKSAELLRQFRAQFGNLGLAAAAYKRCSSTRSRLACWKTDIAVGDVGLCSHRHRSLRRGLEKVECEALAGHNPRGYAVR